MICTVCLRHVLGDALYRPLRIGSSTGRWLIATSGKYPATKNTAKIHFTSSKSEVERGFELGNLLIAPLVVERGGDHHRHVEEEDARRTGCGIDLVTSPLSSKAINALRRIHKTCGGMMIDSAASSGAAMKTSKTKEDRSRERAEMVKSSRFCVVWGHSSEEIYSAIAGGCIPLFLNAGEEEDDERGMMRHLAFSRGVFESPAMMAVAQGQLGWESVHFAIDGELCILSEGEAIGDFITTQFFQGDDADLLLTSVQKRLMRMYHVGMRLSQEIPRITWSKEKLESVVKKSPAVTSLLMEIRAVTSQSSRKSVRDDDEDDV